MTVQKAGRYERSLLKGSLRKNGFERWRLVTNASSISTGEERAFFIEFYVVNPSLSPKECILGFKSRHPSTDEDAQRVLAGTQAAQDIVAEQYVQPSFVMVKAGTLSQPCKQMNAYFCADELDTVHSEYILKVGTSTADSCILTSSTCTGAVTVTSRDLEAKPELLCQEGRMSWDLQYKRHWAFAPESSGEGVFWAPLGSRTHFSGKIVFDGEEFEVNPKKSFGYIDKNWGKDFSDPFFHLSSCNFTSIINGKNLKAASLAVQGVYNNRLSVLLSFNGTSIELRAGKHKKYTITYDFTELPEDEEGVRVHWSVSVHNRHTVVDIDVYCNADSLFLRDYESPDGKRKVMRVLGSANGVGEIRVYKKIKKTLEVLEHVRIANVVCEYGHIELPTV